MNIKKRIISCSLAAATILSSIGAMGITASADTQVFNLSSIRSANGATGSGTSAKDPIVVKNNYLNVKFVNGYSLNSNYYYYIVGFKLNSAGNVDKTNWKDSNNSKYQFTSPNNLSTDTSDGIVAKQNITYKFRIVKVHKRTGSVSKEGNVYVKFASNNNGTNTKPSNGSNTSTYVAGKITLNSAVYTGNKNDMSEGKLKFTYSGPNKQYYPLILKVEKDSFGVITKTTIARKPNQFKYSWMFSTENSGNGYLDEDELGGLPNGNYRLVGAVYNANDNKWYQRTNYQDFGISRGTSGSGGSSVVTQPGNTTLDCNGDLITLQNNNWRKIKVNGKNLTDSEFANIVCTVAHENGNTKVSLDMKANMIGSIIENCNDSGYTVEDYITEHCQKWSYTPVRQKISTSCTDEYGRFNQPGYDDMITAINLFLNDYTTYTSNGILHWCSKNGYTHLQDKYFNTVSCELNNYYDY